MRTLFAGGRVFDGTGSPPAEADVAVEDGRVVDVGRALDGDEAVDASGKTLLPGLFDCHTHVTISGIDLWQALQTPFSYRFYQSVRNLEATLRAGITTARDAAGADLGLKRALEDGLVAGPRLQIAITMISQTGGHNDDRLPSGYCGRLLPSHPGCPSPIADGPDEVRRKVRELVRHGADVIKVATSGGVLSPGTKPRHAHYAPEELDVLVAEARAAGLPAMAHALGAAGVKNAVRAGVRSIEHGIDLDDEAIALMLERGTFLVPTLSAPDGVLAAAEAGATVAATVLAKAREVCEAHRDSFRRAAAAGVRIAMGTDSGVTPHGENLRELELMRRYGLSPASALAAATSSAAELLGVADELGTIEPGKRADLVVLDGDPFELGTLRERIDAVYQDGRLVAAAPLGAPVAEPA